MPSPARVWLAVALSLSSGAASGQPAPVDRHGDPLPPCVTARLGTVRWRHQGTVASLAFSADGSLLASAGSGFVHVWDTATGRTLPRFTGRIEAETVAFSPDGTTLLAARGDGILQQWDVATATLRREHRPGAPLAHLRPVFSPDGSILALLDGADAVHLVQVATGRDHSRFRDERGMLGAAISHDGTTLATGGVNEVIRLRDLATDREVRTFKGHAGWVFALRFSPDDRTLAAATGENIRLWDVATGRVVHNLPATGTQFAFAPDGRLLAGHSAGEILLWDLRTGLEVRRFGGQGGEVVGLAFSADGRTLAVAFCGRAIELWDVATGKPKHSSDGHRGAIDCVAVSPNGTAVATGSRADRSLVLWDLATRTPKHVCADGAATVVSAAFSPDGATLAAGDGFPTPGAAEAVIRLWDARDGTLRRRFAGHRGGVHGLAFAPDGQSLASAGEDAVYLWDAAGTRLRAVPADDGRNAVAFSPDGRALLTFGASGRANLWQVATGERMRSFPSLGPPASAVPFAAFLPDGKTVATWAVRADATQAREVHFRDAETGKALRSIVTSSANAGGGPRALSPDGKLFVEAETVRGSAPLIRVWDAETGRPMCSLSGHAGAVLALAFSADGKRLLSGSEDTTVLVWDVRQFRLEHLWAELTGGAAEDTARQLAALGPEAVPFLKDHLSEAAAVEGRAAGLVIDLDSDDFEKREQASAELAKIGTGAEYALRLALADRSSPEVRRRVVALLEAMESDPSGPPARQARRALQSVAILEEIGTAKARQALSDLSRGPAEARVTVRAKAAFDRLSARE